MANDFFFNIHMIMSSGFIHIQFSYKLPQNISSTLSDLKFR